MDSDKPIENGGNKDIKAFRKSFNEIYDTFDKSSAADVLELREIYRKWNCDNCLNFDESDDVYFGLVDDFLSRSGAFEGFSAGPKVDHDGKSKEMTESISLQRQMIDEVSKCTSFDSNGNIVIINQGAFDRLSTTISFLDRVTNDLLQKPQLKSPTCQSGKYLSGLRSMIGASLLARGAGFKVEFGPEKYDIGNDLDMILVSESGKRIGLDVTTGNEYNGKFGFYFNLDDRATRITGAIAQELSITNRSKLIIPSKGACPQCYDPDLSHGNVGFPSQKMISDFRNIF